MIRRCIFSALILVALPLCGFAQTLPDAGYEVRTVDASALTHPYYTSAFGGEFQIEAPAVAWKSVHEEELFFHFKRFFFTADHLDHAPVPLAASVPRRAPYDPPLVTAKSVFVYELAIKNADGVPLMAQTRPIILTFAWPSNSYLKKTIYWWDGNAAAWKPLPSTSDFDRSLVSAPYSLPYGQFAVFEDPNVFEGWASWYRFRGGNFAAFKEYAKGDQYQVTNITPGSPRFGKSVKVTVNDYGPEPHTGRVIDLDAVAFGAIARLKSGVGLVRVTRIAK